MPPSINSMNDSTGPGTPSAPEAKRPQHSIPSPSALEAMTNSPPAPSPSAAPQFGAEMTKVFHQGDPGDGVFKQIPVTPVLESGKAPQSGNDRNTTEAVIEDGPTDFGQTNKTTGNKVAPRAPATHAVGAGVIKGGLPPGFGPGK